MKAACPLLAWFLPGQCQYLGWMESSRLVVLLSPALTGQAKTKTLEAGLRSLILEGRLVAGARLPTERALAESLGLSRSTVTAAYQQLRGEGFLNSRRGAGTFAEIPSSSSGSRLDDGPGGGPTDLVDLTMAALPAPAVLADVAVEAAASLPVQLAGHGLGPEGLPELRAAIADDYTERGLPTRPVEVLITSGALHAWDLVLRTFARPGASVVIEQPTYPAVIDAALAHRTRVRPLPVDADGWHPDELAAGHAPVLAHLTLDGHNPTGSWADDDARRRLLAAFDPSTIIVSDETMAEFPHTAPVTVPTPRAGGPSQTVLAVGSASKSFWAGLRVGWIRGPASLIRRLAVERAGQDLAPPVLEQLMTTRLLLGKSAILPERRRMAGQRRDALLAAIARHCPTWSVTPPAGGLAAWVELGGGSSTLLARHARDEGVRVTPGPRFTVRGTHDGWLRLPLALAPEQLDDALARLARAADRLGRARPRGHQGAGTAWTA